jgi:hypothetical protein
MKHRRPVLALLAAALASCMATGEAQRPAVVVAALGKAADAVASETQQRQSNEPFRGLPVVVRSGAPEGTETVLAEMLRTRLVERGTAVEVACPAKCLEITLTEFVTEAAAVPGPGQVTQITTANATAFAALPRPLGAAPLASGLASAALVTFAIRDGNRYSVRQQVIAGLAIAKNPDAGR